MSMIFNQLHSVALEIKASLARFPAVKEEHQFSWPNYVHTGQRFRRAHLDIVDARETKKLYMMHLCVFPHVNDPSPIYGFDIIAGENKVTGAFHDFSPVEPNHPLVEWFGRRVEPYQWSKERQLPEWARNIFSGHMVAAGNIQDANELKRVLDLALSNLGYYLNHIGSDSTDDYTKQQDWYCHNQRQNPHTPRVMASLGLDPKEVEIFIQDCLFPMASPS